MIKNLNDSNYKLAADWEGVVNEIPVHGLVGIDIIQFIKEMRVVGCMNGSALQIGSGLISFGNCNHFLYPEQMRKICESNTSNNFETIVSKVNCPETSIFFVTNPPLNFEDPLESYFDESSVERRID